MRKGLIFTTLLAAMLVGVMMYAVSLLEARNQRQEEYLRQSQMLEQQAQALEEKEKGLADLVQRYENGLTAGAAELAALQTELETLRSQRDDLQTQLDQVIADIETTRQNLENEDSDQSYYLEVYNALTEGLNKVKGYIAGN